MKITRLTALIASLAIALTLFCGCTNIYNRYSYGAEMIDDAEHLIKKEFAEQSFGGFLKSNLKLAVSVVLGSVLTLLLPNLMSLVTVFGNYVYKAEFTFMSLILMQLLTLMCVYSGDLRNVETHKRLLNSYPFIISLVLAVAFTALCLIIRPLGNFFGVVANPLPYFLLSFVPVIAFGLCYFVMTLSEKGEDM